MTRPASAPGGAAREGATAAGLAERIQVVVASFFDPLPAGAGGYLLSDILHNWDDDRAVAILRRCADAAGPDGSVFVIERLGEDGYSPSTEMDMRMLAYFGRRQRGLGELAGLAARSAALGLGAAVARVLQPYRVRGARAPGSPERQDTAWLEIIEGLRQQFPAIPLVQGGRSNGARLACRTARRAGARAVVALAFPLHPPGRPERSRAAELRAAGTDVLVVNGAHDPFGIPDRADAARVVVLPGETHGLAKHPEKVGQAVTAWLGEVLGLASGQTAG